MFERDSSVLRKQFDRKWKCCNRYMRVPHFTVERMFFSAYFPLSAECLHFHYTRSDVL